MSEQKLTEAINRIFDGCYSKDLSVCPEHTIFQRQKALNELVALMGKQKQLNDEEIAEALDEARYAGCLSGIREVVEWVKLNLKPMGRSRPHYLNQYTWEAKLKEWGLDPVEEVKDEFSDNE